MPKGFTGIAGLPLSPPPVTSPITDKEKVSTVWANWFRDLKKHNGVQGETGIGGGTGIQGQKGATGLPGPVGACGAQGIQGATGLQGTSGIQGVTGVIGACGAPGIQGQTGIQGMTGIQGPGVQDMTRSLTSAYPGATIEIGNINTANHSFDCVINAKSDETDFRFSNAYRVTGYANCTGGAWQLVDAIQEADSYTAMQNPTIGLEINCGVDGIAYFRLRVLRTIGAC